MSMSVANPATAMPVASGDINQYLQQIADISVLSADEERALAVRLRNENDLDAARRLVLSQLRFVVHIARSYTGYGLPLGDLVQEGNVGLMKAVKRFDPDIGVRLISFAVHWIRAEIHEFVIRNWRIVKVATTKVQRKLFFKLRGAKKELGWFSAREVQDVAADLGVEPQEVREMEGRLWSYDMAFDGPDNADEVDMTPAPANFLRTEQLDPSQALESSDQAEVEQAGLRVALAALDERSQSVVQRRWLGEKKATLHELAAEYGVSAERIRQIEQSALRKLKAHMLEAVA